MKKYLAAVLGLLLVAAASLVLPSFAMEWQDDRQVGTCETEDTEAVVLTEQAAMSLCEKIQLMNTDTVNYMTMLNGKNYTQDTLKEKLLEELEKLEQLGILEDFDRESTYLKQAELIFYMDTWDSERSVMLWDGTVYNKGNYLHFFMDDETGKILSFNQIIQEYTDASASGDVREYVKTAMDELAENWAAYLGCQVLAKKSDTVSISKSGEVYDNSMEYVLMDDAGITCTCFILKDDTDFLIHYGI
jgi:hypothetical protein